MHSPSIRLEVRGVNKYSQLPMRVQVLNNIHFIARAGEFLALTGVPASGLTALLQILQGLDTDCEGTVWLDGVELLRQSDEARTDFRRRNIGFVLKEPYLLGDLTVLENTMIPLRNSPAQVREAMMALEKVGLAPMAREKSSRLTLFQASLAGLARAIVNGPRLVISDDGGGQLDRADRTIYYECFRQLASSGCTVLAASQDPLLACCADRTLEIRDGQVLRNQWKGALTQ